MKKKLTLSLLILLLISSFTYAGDYKFLFGALGMHEDQLAGIGPTYLDLGIGRTDITFIENNSTELQLYVGGGTEKRKLWNSTTDGSNASANEIDLDLIRGDLKVRLNQGFFEDVLTASVAVDGIFEYFQSGANMGANTYYPDLEGQNNLGTYFTASLKLDYMNDDMFTQDGFSSKVDFAYAPEVINSFVGKSDFYSANLDLQFAKTLNITKAYDTDRNLFSLVLVDRVVVNYTDGDAVPTYYRKSISLGRKVRGFSGFSYNNKLTFVNNLDLRISVFELDEISFARVFPRFNFFFDAGYGMLDYINTNTAEENIIASTGVQATISVSDFADLGYQFAYILAGENFESGNKVVGSLTLMLDF